MRHGTKHRFSDGLTVFRSLESGVPGRRTTPRGIKVTKTTSVQTTLASWLIGPIALIAIAAGLSIVRFSPGWIVATTLGLILGGAVLWVLVSSLAAAAPDRTCPACGQDSLERMDPATTRGVACGACDWSDPSRSAFYMAEEEEASIEAIVIAERDQKTRRPSMSEVAP